MAKRTQPAYRELTHHRNRIVKLMKAVGRDRLTGDYELEPFHLELELEVQRLRRTIRELGLAPAVHVEAAYAAWLRASGYDAVRREWTKRNLDGRVTPTVYEHDLRSALLRLELAAERVAP